MEGCRHWSRACLMLPRNSDALGAAHPLLSFSQLTPHYVTCSNTHIYRDTPQPFHYPIHPSIHPSHIVWKLQSQYWEKSHTQEPQTSR